MHRCAFLGLMLLSASSTGQMAQPLPSPSELLQRVRARLVADAVRMPRYTCAQNITRQMYRASSPEKRACSAVIAAFDARKRDPQISSWDRLQLDVAIADNREIHAWPGATRFSEDEVRRFLGPGAMGTGDFGTLISGIFGGSAAVKFQGKHVQDGRTLFDYTYEVAPEESRYQVETGSAPVITAYSGTFVLDPQTADIVGLTVRTAELPGSTGMCQARSQIEYGRLDIHGREILIPRETRLRVMNPDGKEEFNTISYSSCREYSSKSVLRFDDAEPSAGAVAPAPQPIALNPRPMTFPAGLAFDCRIVTAIDSDTAAAGVPIEAILRSPLRGKDKAILAPRGARIHGRLVRFVDHKSLLDYFEIGMRLESIEVNGAEVPLYAKLANQAAPPRPDPGAFFERDVADLPAAPPPNVGEFFFVQNHVRLHQLDSTWITTSPETEKENPDALAAKAQKQIFETAVQKVILAINYSQKAVDLQNLNPFPTPGSFCDLPNLQDILAYRRKAIEAGESADSDVLNNLYAGLGDKFKYEFLESLSLFVHGCAMQAQFEGASGREVGQSRFLWGEWADWYEAHRKAIEEAVTLRELDSEWNQPGAPPAPR